MAPLEGFWSYAHDVDRVDRGRVRDLAHDVKDEFDLREDEPMGLFVDRDSIEWGNKWREVRDTRLDSVGFFVAILTPGFFRSSECRLELQTILRRTSVLVLPIYYITIEALEKPEITDDLMARVKEIQWVDWRDRRFAEPQSESYRRGVAELAERLVRANRQAEAVARARSDVNEPGPVEDEEEPLGLLDRLALYESTLPQMAVTGQKLASILNSIADAMNNTTQRIEGQSFVDKLNASRQLARDLTPLVEETLSLSNVQVSQLHDVDQGIRDYIRLQIRRAFERPEEKMKVCSYLDSTRRMAESILAGMNATQRGIDSNREATAREMRPIFRRIREAEIMRVEGKELVEDWIRLIDSSGIECADEEYAPSDAS